MINGNRNSEKSIGLTCHHRRYVERLDRTAADCDVLYIEAWLSNADGYALSCFTADTDAGVEFHIVSDVANLR